MKNYEPFRFLAVVIILSVIVFAFTFPYVTSETVTFTVTDKERVVKSESSKYLVFTDSESFENTDCFLRFKFNSSDIQGRLKRGKTYKAVVYGWRVPVLSWCRNIVKIESGL